METLPSWPSGTSKPIPTRAGIPIDRASTAVSAAYCSWSPIRPVGAASDFSSSNPTSSSIASRRLAPCPDREAVSPSRPWEKYRSEEHTSELQSRGHLVCRLLLEKKKNNIELV